ncbi:MAG: 30S ribosomal protein S4 [Bdellovibrionota bacterium]
MSKKIVKPRFKVQRRLATELPGLGKAGALERRPYPPGQHGDKRKKYTNFGLQIEEKQKLIHHYGLREKQLLRFIRDSKTGSSANWISTLAGLLERRLDNVVFRLNFAPSIRAARQLIGHGHVLVNGKKVDIGSFVCEVGDEISLKEKSYEHQSYVSSQASPRMETPSFLSATIESNKAVGKILSVPGLESIPFEFIPSLVTEFYSMRKA